MKEKIKYIIIFIAGIIISTVTSVYAATVITAGEVSYTSNSNTTVQTGLDNLYTKANTMANTVSNLPNTTNYWNGGASNVTSFTQAFSVSKTGYYLFTFNVRLHGSAATNNYYHISLSSGGDPLGGAAVPADYRFTTATFIYKMTSTSVTFKFDTANKTNWTVRGYWTYLAPA